MRIRFSTQVFAGARLLDQHRTDAPSLQGLRIRDDVLDHLIAADEPDTIPLVPLSKTDLPGWLNARPAAEAAWVHQLRFEARAGETAFLPGVHSDDGGPLAHVLIGLGDGSDPWVFGGLPFSLPPGSYRLDGVDDPIVAYWAALGWALGGYAFTRYKSAERVPARLVWPQACNRECRGRHISGP